MEFIDLKAQYKYLKTEIDESIAKVLNDGNYILGQEVQQLEKELAEFVGVKHCISCANGTDALTLALRCLNIGANDAVFVPTFTFFATAETVALERAVPVFVDVDERTFNISVNHLEEQIQRLIKEGRFLPKAIISVDLFGQPANYPQLERIAKKYNMYIIEDGAQGFGGDINGQRVGSFGEIATTSFFPAKPLGCYGDGGALFTNNDGYADLLRSLRFHGKGNDKYDNVNIGYNSRLDTVQAAILRVKLKAFREFELNRRNEIADIYTKQLSGIVEVPFVPNGFGSSWAQYTVKLEKRDDLKQYLNDNGIPSMIYYPKAMHNQTAFSHLDKHGEYPVADSLVNHVLSLPMHPYLEEQDVNKICDTIKGFFDAK